MRTLASVIALAVVLAWPSVGEAQSNKKSSARVAGTAQQNQVQRPAVVANRGIVQRCAGYAWWGCVGWDPDPNVRTMLARDIGGDD